jgi:hypothetical protein
MEAKMPDSTCIMQAILIVFGGIAWLVAILAATGELAAWEDRPAWKQGLALGWLIFNVLLFLGLLIFTIASSLCRG